MRKFQYYDSGADGDRDAYSNNWEGQTFTPETTHLIGSVKLKLFKVGSPGTITVSIRATADGKPTGGDLCVGTIDDSVITEDSNGEWYEITLGDGYQVAKNTQYAIVIRATAGDVDNKISMRADTSDPTYAGGSHVDSSDSGADWSSYSGVDLLFEEWGVGEPSPTTITWGLLPKSQISVEKIEEAIARMIQDHEDDPDAHLEEGESLQSHKASEIIDHVAESIIADKIADDNVWEHHRHSISAWKRLLDSRPEIAAKMKRKAWTGEVGENNGRGLTFDGTHVYLGLNLSPGKVIKIDIATMETVDSWTAESGDNLINELIFDGTYIYASFDTTPGKVIQIDPSDMSTVATWEGAAGENYAVGLTFDGTYVYVGLYTNPGKVIKIDPSDMSTAATWEGTVDQKYPEFLTFDGTYIYAGLSVSAEDVIQIDTSDMSTVATWTPPDGETPLRSLIFDGSYLYVGYWMEPARVIQIDPSDMSTVATWEGEAGENKCNELASDGTHVYAGLNLSPTKVIKIDPSDMSTTSIWTGATGDNNADGFAFDGFYLFTACYTSPARVIRKIIRDTNETEP